jgi:uncharacterized protein YjeT (DUF2065 family)
VIALQDLLAALALLLILEGILPSLFPAKWRQTIQSIASLSDRQLRIVGLICVVLGGFILNVVRS